MNEEQTVNDWQIMVQKNQKEKCALLKKN